MLLSLSRYTLICLYRQFYIYHQYSSVFMILFKYWLQERVPWEIVTPRKTMSTEAKPRFTLVFEGGQFPKLPSRAVIIYYIVLNVNQIHCLHYVIGFKTIQVKWIFVFVFQTPYIQTLIRHQSESMVNRTRMNFAQSIFSLISPVVKQYHPLPSSITC